MIDSEFEAAMSCEDFFLGERCYRENQNSRTLSMLAGLTQSSTELKQAWTKDPELYLTMLKGAIAAYEENQTVKELLVGSMARLASVIHLDQEDKESRDTVGRAMEIIYEDIVANRKLAPS